VCTALLLLLLLLLLLPANGLIPEGTVLQCKDGQFNTVRYNRVQHKTITHITQNSMQLSRKTEICKITTTKKITNTH